MATVLIIGASRGIGLETMKAALKAGHSVRETVPPCWDALAEQTRNRDHDSSDLCG